MKTVKHVYILNPFQRTLDTLFAFFIIAVLMGIAAHTFMQYRETAKLCQVIGGATFMKMKWDMVLSHALHGDWPKNDQEALKDGWAQEYYSEKYSNLKAAAIENGAAHFQLFSGNKNSNKILTIRPAVPASDSLGPVVWICGKPAKPSLWTIAGMDKTTIDHRYFPHSWR